MIWTEEDYKQYLSRRGKQPKEAAPKRNKYHAKKIRVDGIYFDSLAESRYYISLKLLTRAGEIKGFCRQPRFVIVEGDDQTRATEYVSDFVVFYNDGTFKIVDVKGMKTEVFKLKMKSFKEKYPKLEIELWEE